IIARYTSFLSLVASAADLTLLESPVSAESQESLTLRRQEIRHIHNCIEQNTMVSVNLNLQFLNHMITRAVEQLGKENRNAAKMLERPMVLNFTEKQGSVRIDAPATRTLLRELRQKETKEIFHASTPPPRASDPAQILLHRSLTQLVTQAANPVRIEYPTPAAGKNTEALTRPMVHSLEFTEALPRESLADRKAHAAPPKPAEGLSPADLIPRRPHGEEKREGSGRKSEAPTKTTTPTVTSLARSAAEAPAKSDIILKTSPIGQKIEAPPRTLPKTTDVEARSAVEAPPIIGQRIEAPPRTLPKAPAMEARSAAEAPSQPNRVITLPKPRQQTIPIGAREQTARYDTPLSVQANQAYMVHPGAPEGQAEAQESIAVQLNPTRKVTRIYRKGMLPTHSEAAQINSQPSPLSQVSQRNDIPAARVLREEAKPTARPRAKESFEAEDDIVDIPTVRVQKNVTKEIGQQSTHQNVAINAPQNSKTTLFTEPAQEISEAELVRITNQVYHTLESRLRNEKMRRGMW
ncbi:MAG: hypothetical protein RRY54_06300, partial [Angelakisella sp.]